MENWNSPSEKAIFVVWTLFLGVHMISTSDRKRSQLVEVALTPKDQYGHKNVFF